jgi:hypothetical protein
MGIVRVDFDAEAHELKSNNRRSTASNTAHDNRSARRQGEHGGIRCGAASKKEEGTDSKEQRTW